MTWRHPFTLSTGENVFVLTFELTVYTIWFILFQVIPDLWDGVFRGKGW